MQSKTNRPFIITLSSLMIAAIAVSLIAASWWLGQASPTIIRSPFRIGNQSVLATRTQNQQLKVEAIVKSQPGLWSVVAVSQNSKDIDIRMNPETRYHAASLMKLLTAITVLQQVEEKKYDLDMEIGNSTVYKTLESMINQSDNFAWSTLNNLAGFNTMQETAANLGLSDTNVHTNYTTAADMAQLLSLLYSKELLSEANTALLLTWMQQTETEDRIPSVIPEETPVIHKTGTLGGYIHDAAIIEYEDPLILVIMGNTTNRAEGTKVIKEVTKSITQGL